jgi:cobalt/nickel transport system permease protein
VHMSDALLSPTIGGIFWAGALGAIAYSSRKIKKNLDEKAVPLMGVMGAFIFAAQMINFAIPGTGSSGHIGGGMILSIMLGSYAAFIVMASVLTVQALFFGDGGLLALGCNIWNLGIYPCFIAYPFIYKPLMKMGITQTRIIVGSLIGAVSALQLGAFSVVIETFFSGRSELPFNTFIVVMQPIHLAIGIIEGFVTAGVIGFVKSAKPEILESIISARPMHAGVKIKRMALSFLIAAIVMGGTVSWLASSNPDGLEWSIKKVYGKTELPGNKDIISTVLKKIQERAVFLPGYGFEKQEGTKEGNAPGSQTNQTVKVETGMSVSGILGALMVTAFIMFVGFGIKVFKEKGIGEDSMNGQRK